MVQLDQCGWHVVRNDICRRRGGPAAGHTELNGALYGTTVGYPGTVYSITTAGVKKVQHFFTGADGEGLNPTAALTNVNGTLYGTTRNGGGKGSGSLGTVFTVTPRS
jgi:hypothetical protein